MTARAPIRRREWLAAAASVAALLWINAYICRDLFYNPTAFMNSMHGFWIALARHGPDGWLAGWFRSTWWPYWDCGIPFEFTYAPLIPALIAAVHAVAPIPHILAFQWVTAGVYCLAPLTLFTMAWLLTRAAGSAFLAALFYSLTAPTQLLVPDAALSWRSFWDARRLYLVTAWDDTPHLTALALLPLAILFLAASLKHRRWRYYIPTVLTIALMAAASEFGPVDTLMAAFCVLFVFRREEWRSNVMVTLGLGVFAWALVAPFYSPSLLRAIARASGDGREPGFSIASLSAAAIVALGWVILWTFLPRWTKDWRVQFFVFFAYLTSSVPLMAVYLHRQFLPQPGRYKAEMEMGLALLLVFALRPWFARARPPVRVALILVLLSLAGEQIASHRRYAKSILAPRDQTQTIEYRASVWADQNLGGTRVMLPGSIAQWANAFTNVRQFSGSSWSQALNPVEQLGVAAVMNGGSTPQEDARVSLAWLQAFGVGAVAVSGPQSQEYWKPFAHPGKFEGILPILWREGDVTIYRVPQRSSSLVHVLPPGTGPCPAHPDLPQIEHCVAALENPALPLAETAWEGTNRIRVRTTAAEGQLISTQVSYHPGWRARAAGRSVPIHRDGLGMMWLDPHCSGPCEVQLDYDGGWELRLSRFVSFAAFLALLALPIASWRTSSSRRPHAIC